jgi:hypothetical protein
LKSPISSFFFVSTEIAGSPVAIVLFDVAQAALWLLSPGSGHITGQTLKIDGGLTLI